MTHRALILCTSCEIGGMERLALGITRQLLARGWDAEMLFADGPRAADVLEWTRAQDVPASTHPAVVSVLDPHRSWHSVSALAALLRSRSPDVMNVHYGGAHISIKDMLAARLARVPRCVAQVHLPVEWGLSGRRKRVVTRGAAVLSDQVVVHSRAVFRVMTEAGVSARKLALVNPGIALPSIQQDREAARKALGVSEPAFVVGCMARLVEHKGVADLVGAFRRVPADCLLLVAGEGPERARLEALAGEVAPGRVRFLGEVREGVDTFFAGLDLFVLPSHLEGFGLVLIEAAMRGVPCVGTRIGGIEDAIVDGRTGVLVPAGSVEDLGRVTCELRASPQLRREIACAAHERAVRKFSEQAMGASMESVLLGSR